jgi:hypothetical protein
MQGPARGKVVAMHRRFEVFVPFVLDRDDGIG